MENNQCKSKLDEIRETLFDIFAGEINLPVKQMICKYTEKMFSEIKNEIKFESTPLKNVHYKKIIKLLQGKNGTKNNFHLLSLYMLQKIPGKPIQCKKCHEKVTKSHLIFCNSHLWDNFLDDLLKNSLIRKNILDIQSKYESKGLLPVMIIQCLTNIMPKQQKETILEKLSHCLQISCEETGVFKNRR